MIYFFAPKCPASHGQFFFSRRSLEIRSPVSGLQPLIYDESYLSIAVPGMQAEWDSGLFATDDLLTTVLANPDSFYHGSHTFNHVSRDELQEVDCNSEDGGTFFAKTGACAIRRSGPGAAVKCQDSGHIYSESYNFPLF